MGMPWRTRLFAWLMEATSTPIEDVDDSEVPALREKRRRLQRTAVGRFVFGAEGRGAEVEEMTINPTGHDMILRIHRPRVEAQPGVVPPVVVNFHGGGWVQGNNEQSGWLTSRIAARADVVVVSVDYRLAPEHPYPAAVEDCWAAVQWVHTNAVTLGVDPDRMAVMGDSAGGNLAAVVALLARDSGTPALRVQVLIYPSVDMFETWPSEIRNAEAPVLTARNMHAFSRIYLDGADGTTFTASPYRAQSHAGVAPALIQTAEFDPLLDNGAKYAEVLAAAGVPATHTCYGGAIHGFMSLPGVTKAAPNALNEIVAALKQAF